jgi:putative spermidine/putrescine transport system ATP-binding protein
MSASCLSGMRLLTRLRSASALMFEGHPLNLQRASPSWDIRVSRQQESNTKGAGEPLDYLRLTNVSKSFGPVIAADGISLVLAKGERISLLGPSGCGKTTLLNLIAGFLRPDAGSIQIGGRDVASVPSHKRNLGIVFQNYALFPHLDVGENVRFGLRMRAVPPADAERRVSATLRLVQLDKLADRYPHQLSGGQQQRVAIARALVIEPELLLLDEPLSNLDAKLREGMRADLLDLLQKLAITTVLVTHDQAEALALSDRIAVISQGKVEQVGTPRQIYEDPATSFVAKFVGESNVLTGKVTGIAPDGIACALGGGEFVRARYRDGFEVGDNVEIIVRMERVRLDRDSGSRTENAFAGTVEHVLFLGGEVRYLLRLGSSRVVAIDKNRGDAVRLEADSPVRMSWPVADTIISHYEEI